TRTRLGARAGDSFALGSHGGRPRVLLRLLRLSTHLDHHSRLLILEPLPISPNAVSFVPVNGHRLLRSRTGTPTPIRTVPRSGPLNNGTVTHVTVGEHGAPRHPKCAPDAPRWNFTGFDCAIYRLNANAEYVGRFADRKIPRRVLSHCSLSR